MYKLLGGALLCATLTGCAGMNSDFDCNKTATDQCLSMGEASAMAAKGKSLDDLSGQEEGVKKPAGEALRPLSNARPVASPDRKMSVPAIAPRPVYSPPIAAFASSARPVFAAQPAALPVTRTITPVDYASAGRVNAQRIPDATQRLWIAPWVDGDDSFHQPAVVEFVKKKARWDQDFQIVSDGE